MHRPQISIITPVFNGGKFIESCLQNVVSQQCQIVEHIILDGGSQDSTIDIIRSYADRYPHIRWVSEKDKGQSDAMNKGIALAQGKVIGILNVDDFYEPGVLNRVAEMFEEFPFPTFTVANCKMWDNEGHLVGVNRPSSLSFEAMYVTIKNGDFFKRGSNLFPFNPSAYFYHKEVHNRVGLYDTSDHYAMDFDFIIRVITNPSISIQYVDEIWGNYRLVANSKSMLQRQVGKAEMNLIKVVNKYYSKASRLAKLRIQVKMNLYRFKHSLPGRALSKIKRKIGGV